jgi:hypothetical protein
VAERRRKKQRWPYLLTYHVFEKAQALDITLAEFEVLLGSGEIIAEDALGPGKVKELLLLVEWLRPLHVVVVVDDVQREERIVTVYEPDPARWSADHRRRRR